VRTDGLFNPDHSGNPQSAIANPQQKMDCFFLIACASFTGGAGHVNKPRADLLTQAVHAASNSEWCKEIDVKSDLTSSCRLPNMAVKYPCI
jgi:hypothetical protein